MHHLIWRECLTIFVRLKLGQSKKQSTRAPDHPFCSWGYTRRLTRRNCCMNLINGVLSSEPLQDINYPYIGVCKQGVLNVGTWFNELSMRKKQPCNHLILSLQDSLRFWLIFFCRIENDKVEGFTITQSFNRQEKWTKALKYTLCNLKWALYWLIGNTAFQPASPSSSIALNIGQSSSSPGNLEADPKNGTSSSSQIRGNN